MINELSAVYYVCMYIHSTLAAPYSGPLILESLALNNLQPIHQSRYIYYNGSKLICTLYKAIPITRFSNDLILTFFLPVGMYCITREIKCIVVFIFIRILYVKNYIRIYIHMYVYINVLIFINR